MCHHTTAPPGSILLSVLCKKVSNILKDWHRSRGFASVVSWYLTQTDTYTQRPGKTFNNTYEYILTPPVMCAQQLPVLNWINDVLIQRFTLQRSTMCFLFRNYSLVEAIHLLIRFKKTNSFLWNIKNTVRNGINGRNRHHTQRGKIILERLFSFS